MYSCLNSDHCVFSTIKPFGFGSRENLNMSDLNEVKTEIEGQDKTFPDWKIGAIAGSVIVGFVFIIGIIIGIIFYRLVSIITR